jgi:cytochrome c-type biogenesis protein
MDLDTLGFAVAAGLVAAVNPCGFAMLPGYLSLVVAGESTAEGGTAGGSRSRSRAVGRALAATAAMATGFVLVFGAFGLVIAPLTTSIEQYLPAVTVVIGVALVALGGYLLSGRELTILLPRPGRGAPTRRIGSMVGYGIAYALASLSCTIGPFLAVTSATFRSGSAIGGLLAYVAYGLGMALVVGLLAVATALASSSVVTGTRRLLPYVNRVSGVLLILSGLYVTYYGVYELRLFAGNGDASDPVIDAAGRLQGVLAGWVDTVGAWPLLVALLLLVTAVVALARIRTARSAGRRSAKRDAM